MSHIFPDNYRVLGNQTMNKAVMGKHILDGIISLPKDTGELDLFPQLFIYGFDARVEPQTEFKMKICMTDYYDSVYFFDTDLYFDLRVEIDRNVTMYHHIQAGDHTVNFGILAEGEHSVSLQVIDALGRKSQRIFYDILVRSYDIPESLTYRATQSDLIDNGITLGLTEASNVQLMKNNKIGLNKLMDDKKAVGFKKLVLPPNGIYRVFHSNRDTYEPLNPYLRMPTEFTWDLNGSNIKLQPYVDKSGLGPNMVVEFIRCYDSHIINGTFEGDWIERDQRRSEFSAYEGEGAGSISFYGHSKFCTLRNVTTRYVTGYNIGASQASATSSSGTWTTNKSVKESTGEVIDRGEYSTSTMEDITKYIERGQVACNIWLGYGGIVGSQFEILFSFYDENRVFLEQIQVFQHRMCKIPLGSKFMRTTVKALATEASKLVLNSHAVPTATALHNCHWDQNRTCAAPAQFQHWLMKNCTFYKSGHDITPCAIDLEDGWEQMQDFFLLDSAIQGRIGSTDLIVNSGMNHHVEGCDYWRITLRAGLRSRVVRNNTRSTLSSTTGWKSGLARYTDNELTNFSLSNNVGFPQVVKNKLAATSYIDTAPVIYGGLYKTGVIKNSTCVGARIAKNDSGDYYDNGNNLFYYCRFVGTATFPIYTIHIDVQNIRNQYLECTFEVPTVMRSHNYFVRGLWSECTFLDTVEINPHPTNTITMGDIQFNNCVFEKPVKHNHRPIQFNNCVFKQGVTKTGAGVLTAQYNNCTGV